MTVQKEQSQQHASQTQNTLQALNKEGKNVNVVQSEFSINVCLEGRSWQQEAEMVSSYVALFQSHECYK